MLSNWPHRHAFAHICSHTKSTVTSCLDALHRPIIAQWVWPSLPCPRKGKGGSFISDRWHDCPAKYTQLLPFKPIVQLVDSTTVHLKHLQTSCIQPHRQQNKLKSLSHSSRVGDLFAWPRACKIVSLHYRLSRISLIWHANSFKEVFDDGHSSCGQPI